MPSMETVVLLAIVTTLLSFVIHCWLKRHLIAHFLYVFSLTLAVGLTFFLFGFFFFAFVIDTFPSTYCDGKACQSGKFILVVIVPAIALVAAGITFVWQAIIFLSRFYKRVSKNAAFWNSVD